MENNEVRYDIMIDRYWYFKCIKCGRIYDIEIYDAGFKFKNDNENFKILSK